MQHLESTLRHHLGSYLAGEISLEDFTNWLVSATWDIEKSGNVAASKLAYAVELSLAEHSSGLLTHEEFQAELRALSQPTHLGLSPAGREQ